MVTASVLATAPISDLARTLVADLNRPGAFQSVQWKSVAPSSAATRKAGIVLEKIGTATMRTGIDYRKMAVNEGMEESAPIWHGAGEWALFPYIIRHRDSGQEYLRLYVKADTIGMRYFVDGQEVSRETFVTFQTPSQAKGSKPNGGTISPKIEGITLLP